MQEKSLYNARWPLKHIIAQPPEISLEIELRVFIYGHTS